MTDLFVPHPLRSLAREHAAIVEAALGPLRPAPGFQAPQVPALFLCFTNRCGSFYAAQLLASTGICNEAGEFFNAETVLEHAVPRGLASLHEYVALLPQLVPQAPVFAAKLGLDQLVMLTDTGILQAWRPRAHFLLLERQDRLAQAISRVIAAQTGAWTHAQQATAAPAYQQAPIEAELRKIEAANAGFYAWFAANGIAPMHTTLESLLRDPGPLLDELASRLGTTPLRADRDKITLQQQAGTINLDWRNRFEKEGQGL